MFRWFRGRCRSTQRVLWEYAQDRLSEGPMEAVERHVTVCAACRQELESVRRAQSLLMACRSQMPPAPRTNWNDLRRQLEREPLPASVSHRQPALASRRGRAYGNLQWASGFATFLIAASLGYYAFLPKPTTVSSPPSTGSGEPAVSQPSAPALTQNATTPSQELPTGLRESFLEWPNLLAKKSSASVEPVANERKSQPEMQSETRPEPRRSKASPRLPNAELDGEGPAVTLPSARKSQLASKATPAKSGNLGGMRWQPHRTDNEEHALEPVQSPVGGANGMMGNITPVSHDISEPY